MNRNQVALLFDREVKTIGKHVTNVFAEELSPLTTEVDSPVIAKFAITAADGKVYKTEHDSIDVMLSVDRLLSHV